MRLYLVRHAESVWNAALRWQGQADPPLSEAGLSQAATVAARLAGVRLDAVVSSDLLRATGTAGALAAPHGLDVVTDPAFRELDVGGWAGLTTTEIKERFAREWDAYTAGTDVRRGGGETLREMHDRVNAAFDELLGRAREIGWETTVLVTHGGVVRAITMGVLGVADRTSRPLPVAAPLNVSITEVVTGRGAVRLVSYNDSSHLTQGAGDTALG